MTRSIAAGTITKLAGKELFVADLIELQLSTTQYITTSNIDILTIVLQHQMQEQTLILLKDNF